MGIKVRHLDEMSVHTIRDDPNRVILKLRAGGREFYFSVSPGDLKGIANRLQQDWLMLTGGVSAD